MGEIWKDIEGYEGVYQVSNMERVKSLERSVPNTAPAGGVKTLRERILKASSNEYYPLVCLYRDGVSVSKRVHLLMCKAFKPKPKEKTHAIFIDGDKSNISLSNLRWGTKKEAARHAVDVLSAYPDKFGEKNPMAKLTKKDVMKIRKSTATTTALAKKFNIGWGAIYDIKKRRSWKHID